MPTPMDRIMAKSETAVALEVFIDRIDRIREENELSYPQMMEIVIDICGDELADKYLFKIQF